MQNRNRTLDQEGRPYEPTPEELVGESWYACYGQSVVVPPPPMNEDVHEYHQ